MVPNGWTFSEPARSTKLNFVTLSTMPSTRDSTATWKRAWDREEVALMPLSPQDRPSMPLSSMYKTSS
eukprot:CAMPEP_0206549370 /NCGR_PEP_ID=MMETSP0325_2-20121206/14428_1 /ASSEMBLY_ACC=CAM_ASM_000347 /TAXON_ID=2866 /ORGANISM="Crypthecodinium cohnii, Strain Seligo" /LENGTH=67 /DNA_ID=CAMNT_0054049007 /DNA_START=337 /DNA_END=540 /DNA_ORIENTATION=-